MNNKVFNEEETNLNDNKKKIELVINNKEDRIKFLDEEIKSYGHASDSFKQELIIEKNDLFDEILNLKELKNKPYFGHMLISSNDYEDDVDMFIGEESINDKNGNNIVYDWRSEAASMFYANQETARIKNILYKLLLKREVEINRGRLISAYESYRNDKGIAEKPIIDEFLKSVLQEKRKLNEFTDIIRTIQAKQNDIIRAPLKSSMLVQGVAGSGKTAIIVHRLSYLLYNNDIKPSQFLFITPSKTFVDKLSDLNRKLKIDKIEMITFEDYYNSIFQKIFNKEYTKGFTLPEKIVIDDDSDLDIIKQLINYEIQNDYLNTMDFVNALNGTNEKSVLKNIYDYKKIIEILIEYKNNNNEVDPNTVISEFFANLYGKMRNYIEYKNIYRCELPSPAQYDSKINILAGSLIKKINNKIEFCSSCPIPMEEAIEKVTKFKNRKNEIYDSLSKSFGLKGEKKIEDFIANLDSYQKENEAKISNLKERLSQKQESIKNFKLKLLRQREFKQLNEEVDLLNKTINNIVKLIEKIKSFRKKEILELNDIMLILNELEDKVDYDYMCYENNKKLIDNFVGIIEYLKNNDYKLTNYDKENVIKILSLINDNIGCKTIKYDFELISQLENIKNSDLSNILSTIDEQIRVLKDRMSPKYLIDILKEVLNNPEYDFKRVNLIDNNRRKILLYFFTAVLQYENSSRYSYIYIDEVQDYSKEDLDLLLKLEPDAIFNFYGDKDQKINGKVDDDFWNYFIKKYDYNYLELVENYRNTSNIVEYCNKNLNTKMVAIGNKGIDVEEKDFISMEDILEQINNLENCVLIADEKYLKTFKDKGIECYTVQESKGLEFSNVVILESDDWNNNYRYVAYTRTLNSLVIYKNFGDHIKKAKMPKEDENIIEDTKIDEIEEIDDTNDKKRKIEEIEVINEKENNDNVLSKILNYKPLDENEIETRIILIGKIKGYLFDYEFEDYLCGDYTFPLIKRIKNKLSRLNIKLYADEVDYEDDKKNIELKISPIENEIVYRLRNNDYKWLENYDISNTNEEIYLLKKILNILSLDEEKELEFKYTKEPKVEFEEVLKVNDEIIVPSVPKTLSTIPEETNEQKEKLEMDGDTYKPIREKKKSTKKNNAVSLFDDLI